MPDGNHTELVRAQMEKILGTPPFDVSPSLSRFLRYIVEETLAGRAAGLRELALGQNVFDRGDSFNPRADPIVRVQARNLRQRLTQYYSGPGAGDPILIELPKGAYVPVFRERGASETEAQPPPEPVNPAVIQPVSQHEPPISKEGPAAASRSLATVVLPVIAIVAFAALALAMWVIHGRPRHGAPPHQPDQAALNLYIRGRYQMDHLTELSLREAVDYFTRAVTRDPAFAAAEAGLADAYNLLAQLGHIAPSEGMEQARRAARQAIAIDPALAEGHVSLAAVIEAYDWDWKAAEREYRRALQLNPALASAHLWYGAFLRDQGRVAEAVPELRHAAALEPFSALIAVNLAHALLVQGDYPAAAEQANHAAELAPELTTASVILAHAYREQAKEKESDAVLERAASLAQSNPHGLALLAIAYFREGKPSEAQDLMRRLEDMSRQRYVSPFDLGNVALTLGQEDRALPMLEEALRQRSSGLIFLRNRKNPSLHDSPRLNSIIDRIPCAKC